MPNNIPQRIAEHAKTKKPTAAGKNRAAFLAIREDIKDEPHDRCPVETIWETLTVQSSIFI
jgi:hypothetical protein